MSLKRWLPTFLGFPAGGLLALTAVGSVDDPLSAAAGGLIAGAVIGAAQWLALRTESIGPRWAAVTAAAMALGTAVGTALTGAGRELGDLMLTGLVAGAAVGGAQSTLLGRDRLRAAGWTAVTAASWSVAWIFTWVVVGVNADEGFVVFGSSGAVLVTVVTGLALRRVLAAPAVVRVAAA